MRQFRGDVGQRIIVEPDLIVVPDTIYDQTCEAVGYNEAGAHSDRDPDSAHYGRINPQSGRWKVMAYPRLDDYTTKSWFMIDSKKMKEFMLWINRLEPDIETISDFETKMFKQSVYSRFGYGWTNWRFIYGMAVS